MKFQLLTAAAMTIVALGAPALGQAAPVAAADDLRHVVVSYGDLNLNTAAGQAAFRSRVRHAAQAVCGDEPDNRNAGAVRDYRACVAKSIGAATAAVPAATMVASNGHNG